MSDPVGIRRARPILKAAEKPFRTGASSARRTAEEQATQAQQAAALDLAESEDEIARRKAVASGRGRGSLIKSSPSGLSTNLGGTG
jgi:hypothetical protein